MKQILFTAIVSLVFNCAVKTDGPNRSYSEDKEYIEQRVVEIISYYKQNEDKIDPKNYFEPYSKIDFTPHIDTIYYSADSLKAFAILVIEKIRANGLNTKFDARGLICYRKEKTADFNVYPVSEYSAIAYDTYGDAVRIIIECYTRKLSRKKDNFGDKFRYNVDDKEFWSKSLYFKKVGDGNVYYFQTYLGDYKEYKEYSTPY